MTINVKNLHPNWRELHAAHISGLEQMVKDNGPQSGEAKRLLESARKDYQAVVDAVNQ